MFHQLLGEPVDFKAPWERETLWERLNELMSGGGERVAYIYERPDSSTFRYRVFNIVEALRESEDDELKVSWFSLAEISTLRSVLPHLSTIVLARVRISRAVSDLITTARAFGVRILMDCDDLVFDPKFAQLVSVNNNNPFNLEAHLDDWYAYVGRLNATALQCDGGITTNRFLAEKLENVCQGEVFTIPNFLNRRQEEISRQLLEEKTARKFAGDGRVTIGYFSGSPTHNKDFLIALDSIIQLMDEDDKVDIRIVGFMDSHAELMRFGKRVDIIPLQDWVNLQVKIAEVEISIAPLQLNDFTNCKSELKYFEAAAVGCYNILSKNYTFEHAVTNPNDARVIHNGQWYSNLKNAVDIVRDTERYTHQANETASRVYARYGWNCNNDYILAALKLTC